jgi:hypothetical protein
MFTEIIQSALVRLVLESDDGILTEKRFRAAFKVADTVDLPFEWPITTETYERATSKIVELWERETLANAERYFEAWG